MNLAREIGSTLLSKRSLSRLYRSLPKCEYLSPTDSIKDHIVAYMVRQVEDSGHLKPGDTLIESTSSIPVLR